MPKTNAIEVKLSPVIGRDGKQLPDEKEIQFLQPITRHNLRGKQKVITKKELQMAPIRVGVLEMKRREYDF